MKLKYFLIALIILIVTGIAVLFFGKFRQGNSSVLTEARQIRSNLENTDLDSADQVDSVIVTPTATILKSEPKPEHKLTIAGWIPTWASAAGLASVKANPTKFTTLSPVWYEVNMDGSLNPKYPANRKEIVDYSKQNNLELLPTIGMFNHQLFSGILTDPATRTQHVDSIVATVTANNYSGIDLDYESISFSDKDSYFLFLQELATKLHARNKRLSVTVLAKWGDNVRYSYRPETRAVQDWARIANYADEIRIMAYDYTYSGDLYPGPIGPTGWIRQILDYAKGKIPPEKTVLGIHLYAYEWYQPVSSGTNLDVKTDSSQNTQQNPRPARAYTYSTVAGILNKYQGEHSSFEGEGIFIYTARNNSTGVEERRALIYIDPDGVKARTGIAKDYGLKGVVFWRLGGEGF